MAKVLTWLKRYTTATKKKTEKSGPSEPNAEQCDTNIPPSNSVGQQQAEQNVVTAHNHSNNEATLTIKLIKHIPSSAGESSNQSSTSENFEVVQIPEGYANIQNESDDDTSDDDLDIIINDDLFTKNTQIFVETEVPTNTIPYSVDSDDFDDESVSTEVKFFIDKCRSIAVAKYDDIEYRVGFLDLTDEEHSYLKLISQTSVAINVKCADILLHENKFNIKGINERKFVPNRRSMKTDEMLYDQLNLGRIHFSSTEPFLAKYDDEIYFVGQKLSGEYNNLLNVTKKCAGTAIRIDNNRLENEFCVIEGSFDSNKARNDFCLNGCQRYVISHDSHELIEVEPELLHSSIYDDRTEIYAEMNFPFSETKIEPIVKRIDISVQPEPPEQQVDKTGVDEDLEMLELKAYLVPPEIKVAAADGRRSIGALKKTKYNDLLRKKSLRNNVNDYIRGSKMMIYLEEEANANYLKKFDQKDIQLSHQVDRQYFFPLTEEFTELATAIEENVLDFLVLHPKSNGASRENDIYGQVYRVKERKIIIEIFKKSFRLIKNAYRNESYDISFLLNRMPYKLQHYALEFIDKDELFNKLIDNSYYKCKSASLPLANKQKKKQIHQFKTEGTMLQDLNSEQQMAVQNIIAKTDKLPYILFGPPGTGKTRTLVAAIEQIVRTTNQHVLVCANSNAACDEITNRLIDVLDETELYRFYAKSYKHERINGRIKGVSNFGPDGIFYPSLKYLYTFRVFVCTLCSAGCLTRARIDDEVWKPDHFSYVFIDECASAHETMCSIPIAGLCTSRREIHAKIVLAGDPKQLDAVTRSDAAKRMGYNTSWLERLCDSNLYKRKNGQFNELYITQLVKNYRSHPEILRIPNELFYENSLETCAKESDINRFIGSDFLQSKNFPFIFKSVKGICQLSLEHSWYNEGEVTEVVKYIKKLLPSPYNSRCKGKPRVSQNDIGVVTPYRKQLHKIVQKLRRLALDEVTVGTTETFQGKEKPIMIISTVRSNGALGFVAEPRRLNVMVTRAKCLVVIVGDPHTLSLDPNWRRLIEPCIRNNSFIQSHKMFSLNEPQ